VFSSTFGIFVRCSLGDITLTRFYPDFSIFLGQYCEMFAKHLLSCGVSLSARTPSCRVFGSKQNVSMLQRTSLSFGSSQRFASSLKFTKDHEWIRVEGKTGTIGISDYAQNALGDVVYVGLPDIGASLKRKDTIAAVESVKVSDRTTSSWLRESDFRN
jgi:hypothetical protein